MTVVLDAGALLAIEGDDRDMVAIIKRERLENRAPLTHGGVVGQVWRGGRGRQVKLARALPAINVLPLDEKLGRQAGVLLGQAGEADVIDAAVVLIANDADEIYTSDPDDLRKLARATGRHVDLIPV